VTGCGKVNSRVCREIGISGFESWKDRSFDIASTEILIGEVSIRRGKGKS
jgi:hypothetical protein